MPDWQPVTVPDLCPRCGAYWECEHAEDATLSFGPASDFEMTAIQQRRFAELVERNMQAPSDSLYGAKVIREDA